MLTSAELLVKHEYSFHIFIMVMLYVLHTKDGRLASPVTLFTEGAGFEVDSLVNPATAT